MSRQRHRRVIIDLGRNGDLVVDNPLLLKGKTVTISLTDVQVEQAEIISARSPKDERAEILCTAGSITIVEVP